MRRRVADSVLFRLMCAVLGIVALVWLGVLLLKGSSNTNPPSDSFGAPQVPSFAADIIEIPPRKVSFDFERNPDHGWVVGIAATIPNLRMTQAEFVSAPLRLPTGEDLDRDGRTDGPGDDVVIARYVTCRYAVPTGSVYVPELSGGRKLERVSSGEAKDTDVWVDRECRQHGEQASGGRQGESGGLVMVFKLPESVLLNGGPNGWSLVFQLRDHVDNLVQRGDREWYDYKYPVTYSVHPRDWLMRAFVPSADEVTVNSPAYLEATSAPPEKGLIRFVEDPVYVALTDPARQQRTTYLVALLSFALPFLAQGALRHLFTGSTPTPPLTPPPTPAQASRSRNPSVRGGARKRTKAAARRR